MCFLSNWSAASQYGSSQGVISHKSALNTNIT